MAVNGTDIQLAAAFSASDAFSATPSEENIANLAMVMVDFSYAEVFDLDAG